MADQYKVMYFPLKGLGETIRLLLSYGGKEFEDMRIPFDQWPAIKKTTPNGQMPILEINGKKFNQSQAIARYLAREFNLAGDNNMESFEIDIAVDNISDFRLKLAPIHFYEQDPEVKDKKIAELEKEFIPNSLDKLEETAAANNGHLALKKLTWADIHFTALVDLLSLISRRDILAGRPNLQKVKDNVLALPQIKAFYEKAPKADF